MQRKFHIAVLIFFVPVVLGYLVVEWATLELPMGYKNLSQRLSAEGDTIEVLLLGSSQMKDAVNTAKLKTPAINLASGDQHHNTDFKLLNQLDFPNLKTVVLEVSYSHFELPHNSDDFWKNSIYLKYYGVNGFGRATYFKDQLVYLSHPHFYSKKLYDHYVAKEDPAGFNEHGFDTLNFEGIFKDLNYDRTTIEEKKRFKINKEENQDTFKTNTELFYRMLDSLQARNLNVIVCSLPMYESYLTQRNPNILRRRDSILARLPSLYKNVTILNKEEDILHFGPTDYWNQSHLNPDGAEKFTSLIDSVLQRLP